MSFHSNSRNITHEYSLLHYISTVVYMYILNIYIYRHRKCDKAKLFDSFFGSLFHDSINDNDDDDEYDFIEHYLLQCKHNLMTYTTCQYRYVCTLTASVIVQLVTS